MNDSRLQEQDADETVNNVKFGAVCRKYAETKSSLTDIRDPIRNSIAYNERPQ